jgi:cell wall-associated NlpC family hydrolase
MTRFIAYRSLLKIAFACSVASALSYTAHAEVTVPPHQAASVNASAVANTDASASMAAGAPGSLQISGPKTALNKISDFTNHASQLAVQAVSMLGIHYKYGGTSPENGMDCSGLVRYVFKEAWGTELPRTSAEISHVGQHVDQEELKPGDLVFYNTLRRGFSHVGIYLGDNKFIHSPSSGGKVRIESMDLTYWKHRFSGARRIDGPEEQKETQ